MPRKPQSFRRYVKPIKKQYARSMRRNPTTAEVILWEELRKQKLGVRFRRQAIIFGWIVDFYCPVASLVVEVDGTYHDKPEQIELDMARDEKMMSSGFLVIRVKNQDVEQNLQSVLDQINVVLCNGE